MGSISLPSPFVLGLCAYFSVLGKSVTSPVQLMALRRSSVCPGTVLLSPRAWLSWECPQCELCVISSRVLAALSLRPAICRGFLCLLPAVLGPWPEGGTFYPGGFWLAFEMRPVGHCCWKQGSAKFPRWKTRSLRSVDWFSGGEGLLGLRQV